MGHVPAFRFSPGLSNATGCLIIRMHLHRKFLVREEEFQQQGKAVGIRGRITYKLTPKLRTELGKGFPLERPIGHLGCIAGQPGFADFLRKLVVGINRREIERAPGTRVEGGLHRKWIEFAHAKGQAGSKLKANPGSRWRRCV